jgi:mitochondrial GTPase 1
LLKEPKFKESVGSWMLIGGMPNIGKSTVINSLRQQAPGIKGKYVTRTSPLPTETRNMQGFKVSENPLAWLIDTPGLMVPNIENMEVALKLGLVGCLKDY